MKTDIGVIVGRFQVHRLHEAHKSLIQSVVDQHSKVIIFLGVSAVSCTARNPLDFAAREKMIRDLFPDVIVLPIEDRCDDNAWSTEIDARVRAVFQHGTVMLYGGRDSFIRSYKGSFPATELEQKQYVNGSDIRKVVGNEVLNSSDFRAGVIYATQNRYPVVYPTVDVAVLHRKPESREVEVLLARKPHRLEYQFIGGFVDKADKSYEYAARREVLEEASIEIGGVRYLGSYAIDDWRYRQEADGIKTAFFAADYVYGSIQPQDDISELRWLRLSDLNGEYIAPMHAELLGILREYLKEGTPIRGQQHHPHGGQLQAVTP